MPSTCGFFGSNSLCTRSFTELFVAGVRFFCLFCAEYTASNVMRFSTGSAVMRTRGSSAPECSAQSMACVSMSFRIAQNSMVFSRTAPSSTLLSKTMPQCAA